MFGLTIYTKNIQHYRITKKGQQHTYSDAAKNKILHTHAGEIKTYLAACFKRI